MIKIKYTTNDGREFDTLTEAELHLKELIDSPKYLFWIDGKKYESDKSTISGAWVRSKLSPDRCNYGIYVEDEPNDKLVQDLDSFILPRKFYAVPYGQWGG